jgi:hypothetical protein
MKDVLKMMLLAYLLHSMTLPERSKPSLIDVKKAEFQKVQEQKLSKSIN